jgi:hypothetical protein
MHTYVRTYIHTYRESEELQKQLDILTATPPVEMWRRDLNDLDVALADFNKRKSEALNRGG